MSHLCFEIPKYIFLKILRFDLIRRRQAIRQIRVSIIILEASGL